MKKIDPITTLITLTLFLAASVLAVLSVFFHYHYIIESFTMFGLSAIMYYITIINMKFDLTVGLLTKVMEDFTKLLEKTDPLSSLSAGMMDKIPGMDIKSFEIKQDLDGKVSTNASPDELNFLKENGPAFIKEMFTAVTGLGDQPLDKMPDKKLADELKKAIDKEDFEKAGIIKKEMERRTKQ